MLSHFKYKELTQKLTEQHITLVAVSKGRTLSEVETLYAYGQRDFGENYVQELLPKYEQLPKDIRWHFIGHLQSNKVKYIAPFITMIQSVDSQKLLQEINRQAAKNKRTIDCLLEIKIAQENTKTGMTVATAQQIITSKEIENLTNTKFRGLMGIASNTHDHGIVRQEFQTLRDYFKKVKQQAKAADDFSVLSMGMSQDYQLAIDEGSTMVRLGSLLFAE
ncbi:YggS family pyridoxal phosphate-dependent enzyme [Candidatus Microgenomates bacterium]|nr:MAG: YggS family pyridoxal phosphate-dependent enzyme [Candidatus Microgenomates bacterium]